MTYDTEEVSTRTSVPVLEADVVGEAVLVLVLSVAVRTHSGGNRHVLRKRLLVFERKIGLILPC